MNRIRRTGTAPVGSGNTAGFAVEDSTGYLVVDAGSDNNRPHRRKAVAPADSAVAQSVFNTRQRFTIAQVNAGASLLPAVKGFKYRLVDAIVVAIGGAATAATSVDILGTQSTASVKLVALPVGGLTQNTAARPDAAAETVAGSFAANDVNTALTVAKTGASIATATHIDFIVSYAIEAA